MVSQDKDIGTTVSIQSQAAPSVGILARFPPGILGFSFCPALHGVLWKVREDYIRISQQASANLEISGQRLQRQTVYKIKMRLVSL
jgi:hypothetical protein